MLLMLTTHSGHHTEGSGVALRIVGPPGRGHVEREAGAVVSEVEGRLAEVGPAQVREPHHEPPPVLAVSLYGRAGPHEAVEAQVASKVRETLQVFPSQLLTGSHGLLMCPEPHRHQESPVTAGNLLLPHFYLPYQGALNVPPRPGVYQIPRWCGSVAQTLGILSHIFLSQ